VRGSIIFGVDENRHAAHLFRHHHAAFAGARQQA
jgi:hypothetical protein